MKWIADVCSSMTDTCRKRPSGYIAVQNFPDIFFFHSTLNTLLVVVVMLLFMPMLFSVHRNQWNSKKNSVKMLCGSYIDPTIKTNKNNSQQQEERKFRFMSNPLELLRFTTPFAITLVQHTYDVMWCDVFRAKRWNIPNCFTHYIINQNVCRVNENIYWIFSSNFPCNDLRSIEQHYRLLCFHCC